MATTYKTPGVFVEEIPKLPPSVAEVETAIPAFIGYTEKADKGGENISGIPTRIASLVEFESLFGGAYAYQAGDIKVTLDEAHNFSVKSVSFNTKVFYLFDSMRLFFDNGGGDCYVVSVGKYDSAAFASGVLSSDAALRAGLDAVAKYDEPTILLFPDAVNLASDKFYPLQQAALAQCAKLQDRVAIFDLQENQSGGWSSAVSDFRDKIGISDLKYGAAYTPWVYTSYAGTVDYSLIRNAIVNSADASIDLGILTSNPALNALVASANTSTDDAKIIEADFGALATPAFPTPSDRYNKLKGDVLGAADGATAKAAFKALVDFVNDLASKFPAWKSAVGKTFQNAQLAKTLDATAVDSIKGLRKFVKDLIAFERNADVAALYGAGIPDFGNYKDVGGVGAASWLGVVDPTDSAPANIPGTTTDFGNPGGTNAEVKTAAVMAAGALDGIFNGLTAFFDSTQGAAETYRSLAQNALYANHPIVTNIVKSIGKKLSKLPPTGGMAGIYARVDNARGVWKAPANETLMSVTEPAEQITAETQANLNVDAVAGKSINAIRAFSGRGTLVWGARTLAGNDNEWRYVNVRRFFNMVEESSKNSTQPFVFEANDANTWVKVQGMLENFLTVLWRQGALQGAKPQDAFYVAVGLGKTMTSLDILEGRMIVEIGMAAVRPAEFIILRFSHLLTKS